MTARPSRSPWERRRPGRTPGTAPCLQRKSEKAPHDLSSLRVFTKVILYVKDNYVDPKRVKPKEMMIAALEYVEKSVPDVLVDGNAETGKLNLNVNGKQQGVRHLATSTRCGRCPSR